MSEKWGTIGSLTIRDGSVTEMRISDEKPVLDILLDGYRVIRFNHDGTFISFTPSELMAVLHKLKTAL